MTKPYNQIEKEKFRDYCNSKLDFIRGLTLPEISFDKKYEAVLVEFRNFTHLEVILKNAIIKLGSEWSFTIVCGKDNSELIKSMCLGINVRIIILDEDNMTVNKYSEMLKTEKFWNLFVGEKILIYQEDSFIFRKGIEKFIGYDYIGAPFQHPFKVGNGGFSLRTRQVMIDCIKRYDQRLTHLVEDLFFSGTMQLNKMGKVASVAMASEFSVESIPKDDTFGGHDFWYANPEWIKLMDNAMENMNN